MGTILTEVLVRSIIMGLVGWLLESLPEDVRESYITNGVLAIMTAPNNEMREMELTAFVNQIRADVQNRL